jgi:hypothetical protein
MCRLTGSSCWLPPRSLSRIVVCHCDESWIWPVYQDVAHSHNTLYRACTYCIFTTHHSRVQYSNAKVAQHVSSFSSQLLQSNVVVPVMPQKQAQRPLGYPTALSESRALLTLIRSTSTFISPAPFTLASIATWGYESRRYGAEALLDDYTSLLHALGSDTYMRPQPYDGTGGDNMDITFRHTTSVSVGSTTYPASNAYFCSVLNPRAGLFIAINKHESRRKNLIRQPGK